MVCTDRGHPNVRLEARSGLAELMAMDNLHSVNGEPVYEKRACDENYVPTVSQFNVQIFVFSIETAPPCPV